MSSTAYSSLQNKNKFFIFQSNFFLMNYPKTLNILIYIEIFKPITLFVKSLKKIFFSKIYFLNISVLVVLYLKIFLILNDNLSLQCNCKITYIPKVKIKPCMYLDTNLLQYSKVYDNQLSKNCTTIQFLNC
jgi:hypothetical protein